ncbi:MAG TPA: Hsp20/alpha crystallin family protein [Burkholderiales bacterium]|nr:Hsp20/alpha crystallin family protein [Burkholderiales bacterium]
MLNVTRYDPLGDVFDGLFKGFFVRPVGGALETGEPVRRARIEVSEQKEAFKVNAELPGVKKEDIKVAVDGDEVSISAETRADSETKDGERVVHSERYYGKVARTFRLGADIDESKVAAKYENGVLELTLPKKVPSGAKQITIQ